MLKFTAGAICGWVAARSLSGDEIVPPSTEEIAILAKRATDFVTNVAEKIQKQNVGDNKNEK
jgi:hypothetical protein